MKSKDSPVLDEAHHAWRVPSESKIKGVAKEEIEEATKWVGGAFSSAWHRGVAKARRI